ncbi:MAG: hypothetical protein HOP19_05610 [Acidobacteria bacterium]|nr:hypothetical protein [Acidobacteriota bacterium]
MDMSQVPQGTGQHPIPFIVISANEMAASTKFYAELFGWQMHAVTAELTGAATPAGPNVALRLDIPEGFPSMVPYLGVPNVDAALEQVVAAGATVERAAWDVPMSGRFARFKDSSGTIYGLLNGFAPGAIPVLPVPFGDSPKPPAGTICSLEMYAANGKAAAQFFGEQFGWGTLETMPQYVAFNPGAGVCGVFQSHTPSLPAVAYIYVENVVAKIAEIEAAGGSRMGDPMPIPGVATFGYFKDPSGSSMGLIGPAN